MAQKEKVYSQVEEAEEIVKELCKVYPDELWPVRPDNVVVLGIENKERGEKSKTLAKVIPIKGAEKAVFQINNVPVRYIIELYWSDWNVWCMAVKEAIIFHELLHIDPEIGKTIRHDCEDFRMMIDAMGVDWSSKGDSLPRLLGDEKIKFNLDLRPSVTETAEGDEIPEGPKEEKEEEEKPTEDADELF